MSKSRSLKSEPTPVDDVRRVRRRLTRQAGGDITQLARQAQRVAEGFREKLKLKSVDLSRRGHRPKKIAG